MRAIYAVRISQKRPLSSKLRNIVDVKKKKIIKKRIKKEQGKEKI